MIRHWNILPSRITSYNVCYTKLLRLPSLETGLVNAFAAPPAAALAFQWFALAKHMTEFRWQPMVGTTVVSMKTWEAIPEPLRGELERAAHEGGARLLQKSRALESYNFV